MEKSIKSIEKGWGEDSTFFSTEERFKTNNLYYVNKIIAEEKVIGKGLYNDLTLIVYCGYKDDKKIFEIESNSNLTITY